jgi:hypothetical protein
MWRIIPAKPLILLVASSGIEPELSALRVGYRGPKGISDLAALAKAV